MKSEWNSFEGGAEDQNEQGASRKTLMAGCIAACSTLFDTSRSFRRLQRGTSSHTLTYFTAARGPLLLLARKNFGGDEGEVDHLILCCVVLVSVCHTRGPS